MKKHAIVILAHGNLNILNKLIELLDSKYFDIYIHMDIKNNIEEKDLYTCKKSKLTFFKKNDVRWGDYSITETELFLFEEASKKEYEYYHFISGVDLPLKSNKEIYEFFHSNYPKEFIHFENPKVLDYKIEWMKYYYNMRGIRNKDFEEYNKKCAKKQKKDGINRLADEKRTMRCGANWCSITHRMVKYFLSQREYIEYRFSFTKISDEFYKQTLIYNSLFRKYLYYKKYDSNYIANMRLIDWDRGNPYVWTIKDYDEMMSSGRMFARKFDEKTDSKIIDKIYKEIKKRNKKK